MSLEKRKLYLVIPRRALSRELIKNSTAVDKKTLRTNKNGTAVILKVVGNISRCFQGHKLYTHKQILRIVALPEWQEPYVPKLQRFKHWMARLLGV